MTNNPYVVACLTANGPDYWGELHVTPYNGLEPIDVLTDEAMQMLEPDFPAAEHVSDALRHIGDRTLCVKGLTTPELLSVSETVVLWKSKVSVMQGTMV